MELTRYYLSIVRRWAWLMITATVMAVTTTFLIVQMQPDTYEDTAKLIVGPGVDSLSPDLNALRTSGQLMQTYAELATTRPILQAVITDLNLNTTPDQLEKNIKIKTNEETQILTIRATSDNATESATIANTVAERLVSLSPTGGGNRDSQLRAQMRDEATKLQEIINSSEARIQTLELSLANISSDSTDSPNVGQIPQAIIAGTDSRLGTIASDLQILTDQEQQKKISNDVLQQQIRNSETTIRQLESALRSAVVSQTQLDLLDQLKSEHDQLIASQRTDVERQHLILYQVLRSIIASTQSRIEQLNAVLESAGDTQTKSLITTQLAQERSRLSDLQQIDLQRRRIILDQSLQQSAGTANTSIDQLEASLDVVFDLSARRSLLNSIVQAYAQLTSSQQAFIHRQYEVLGQVLDVSIASTRALADELETSYLDASSAEDVRLLREAIDQERARLSEAHQSLAMLFTSLQDSSTNQLKIIEPATVGQKVSSQLQLKLLIAGLAGLVVATCIALAFEYFDVSIRSAEDLKQVTDAPILANLSNVKKRSSQSHRTLILQTDPDSQVAQNYRVLASRLGFMVQDQGIKSILISNTQIGADTTNIAANLAIALVQTGKRTVLLEANLHQPKLGHLFGITEIMSLRRMLTEKTNDVTPKPPSSYNKYAKSFDDSPIGPTPIAWAPGLSVLPAGPMMSNPLELLTSGAMSDLIAQLEIDHDIVLISTMPQTTVGDDLVLASKVDGIILVVESGKTKREAVTNISSHVHSIGATLLGIIMNGGTPNMASSIQPMTSLLSETNGHASEYRNPPKKPVYPNLDQMYSQVEEL